MRPWLGALFAVALVLLCGSCTKKTPTLNLLVWEGYADPSYVEVFEDENHGKVSASYMGSSDELVAKLRGGSAGTCDVISPSSDVAIMIATSNLAARWPLMTNQLRKVSFPVGETIPERRHAGLDRPPHAEGEFLTILGESGSGKTRWAIPLGRGHDRLAEGFAGKAFEGWEVSPASRPSDPKASASFGMVGDSAVEMSGSPGATSNLSRRAQTRLQKSIDRLLCKTKIPIIYLSRISSCPCPVGSVRLLIQMREGNARVRGPYEAVQESHLGRPAES
jgi:hypothetical protein